MNNFVTASDHVGGVPSRRGLRRAPAQFCGVRAPRPHGLWAGLTVLLAFACTAPAQVALTGSVSAGGGISFVDGDQAAFQQRLRPRKYGYGGLEEFSVTRTTGTSLFRFEGRLVGGNEDYRLTARWEKFDALYLEANYQQFRTFYDGSGGRFLPRDLSFSWFDEELALDRSYFSFEIGTLIPDRPMWRLRYDRNTRTGAKNSLRWGDSNRAGQPFVPRAFIPSYLLLDEDRDIFTVEASQRTDEAEWNVGGRYERTHYHNRHTARRRAGENQDRYVTMNDAMDSDLFSGHGFYERIFSEQLRVSAGGLVTSIDADLAGSKIYGGSPDPEYSATFARRQPQDVGYFGLAGNSRMKQYVGNVNLVYQPGKYWTVRPGLKYEHLRQDSGESHTDTDFGGGAAAAAIRQQVENASRNAWNEITEEVEVRYARWADVALNVRAQANQGIGNLVEQSMLVTPTQARVLDLDRETEYQRLGQRYTVNASWYARPGLTLAAQYNYRLKLADYDHRRDSTPNGPRSFDRYPAYIVDQDMETHDGFVQLTWRPKSMLTLVTRYGHHRTTIRSTMAELPEVQHGRLTRHILTQTATWNATARLFVSGSVNLMYDQLAVPANRFTYNSDNHYLQANLSTGYAVGKVTDLYLDVTHLRADDYLDNPAITLPMGAGHNLQTAFLTWVRRHSDRLIYTAKYGYARNRDGTFGGLNDFSAHLLYGKVQYKF